MSTHSTLCALLRTLDTQSMTTADVLDACLAAAPAATVHDVTAALEHVAREHTSHASQLDRYVRCRRAGIRGVIDGDGPSAA